MPAREPNSMQDDDEAPRAPSMSRPAPARQIDEDGFFSRIETTLTEAIAEDVILAYKLARCRSKQEWLRELIVRELYGMTGVMRLRDGLPPNKPEFPR